MDAATLAVHDLLNGAPGYFSYMLHDGSVWLRLEGTQHYLHFAPDGTRLGEHDGYPSSTPAPGAAPSPTCDQAQPGDLHAVIGGTTYHANCGAFSPGGTHMLYRIDLVPNASSTVGGAYQDWVLDLRSGANVRIDATLHDCGGCDLRAGPTWSPSGRYLIVTETGGDAVYLYDAVGHTTRSLGQSHGMGDYLRTPTWSPDGDRLLYPDNAGGTVLEDLDRGTKVDMPSVAWPAGWAWHSPSLVYSPQDPGLAAETTIADPKTGAVIAHWAGAPVRGAFIGAGLDERGVARYAGQPAALLSGAPGCSGILVEHPLAGRDGICLRDAVGGVFSPDATKVAFARSAEDAYRQAYEIAVIDLATGIQRTVPTAPIDAGGAGQPPLVRWTADGSAIFVAWPPPGL